MIFNWFFSGRFRWFLTLTLEVRFRYFLTTHQIKKILFKVWLKFDFLSKDLLPIESCPQNSTTEVTLMYILRKHKSGFIRNLEIEFPSKYETFKPFRKAITFDGVCFHKIKSMIPNEALNFMKAHLNNVCSNFFYITTDYGHTMAKSLFLFAQIQIPNRYLGCGYKSLVFL